MATAHVAMLGLRTWRGRFEHTRTIVSDIGQDGRETMGPTRHAPVACLHAHNRSKMEKMKGTQADPWRQVSSVTPTRSTSQKSSCVSTIDSHSTRTSSPLPLPADVLHIPAMHGRADKGHSFRHTRHVENMQRKPCQQSTGEATFTFCTHASTSRTNLTTATHKQKRLPGRAHCRLED